MNKSRNTEFRGPIFSVIAAAGIAMCRMGSTADARLFTYGIDKQSFRADDTSTIPAVVVRRSGAAVGPRGGAVVRRSTIVRPGVRPVSPVVRPGRWVRPGWYRWLPGGATAAGAAIGFVTAATAAEWAGSPPLLVLHRSKPEAGVLGRLPVGDG